MGPFNCLLKSPGHVPIPTFFWDSLLDEFALIVSQEDGVVTAFCKGDSGVPITLQVSVY